MEEPQIESPRKILVCMKYAPRLDPQHLSDGNHSLLPTGEAIPHEAGSHDEYALEEALLIKDLYPTAEVDTVTVGPATVEQAIKGALEKGADNSFLLRLKARGLLSSSLTAAIVADWLGQNSYDLIITGAMSEDLNASMFGPALATRLNLPWATSVIETRYDWKNMSMMATCELEGGVWRSQQLPLPGLLTVVSGINRPRYPALSHKLRAKKQAVQCIDIVKSALTEKDPHQLSIFRPPGKTSTEYLEGTTQEKAAKLLEILHGKSLL
jgi:electron transfer flavoprotein alpha/beta subunit